MATFRPDRWRVLDPYLDRVLEMPEEDRAGWLASLAETQPGVAAELQALLGRHHAVVDEAFLERGPALPGPGPVNTGATIGAYTLRSPLGEGGMGTVWLARRNDGRYEGQVAIKFLGLALGRRSEERFRREGTILARLRHPHIAHIIDAGVSSSGQPYLVLEHVDGVDIVRYLSTCKAPSGRSTPIHVRSGGCSILERQSFEFVHAALKARHR